METTAEHFALFKSECDQWIKRWGLLDWDIIYTHVDLNTDLARLKSNYTGKNAVISLGINWEEEYSPITTYQIKKSAFHEIMELLLAEYDAIATSRCINEDEVNNARHTVIRRLENVVFEEMK